MTTISDHIENYSKFTSIIKNDAMETVSSINQVKEQLAQQNLHFLELNRAIEKGLNVFLNASKLELEHSDKKIENDTSDNFINLKELLTQITQYISSKQRCCQYNLIGVTAEIYVFTDHKYFPRALEILLSRLFNKITPHIQSTLIVESQRNFNDTTLLTFCCNDLALTGLREICDSEFLNEVAQLNGITLEARNMGKESKIALRIPAYRIYERS